MNLFKQEDPSRRRLPVRLEYAGWFVLPGTLFLCARILYEETIMTVSRGPQMVGFSLVHAMPLLFVAGMLSFVGANLWVGAAAICIAFRKQRPMGMQLIQLILLIISLGLLYIPYSFWESLLATSIGANRHNGDSLLIDTAADGNIGTVQALLAQGYMINFSDSLGRKPLVAAGNQGQADMVLFLIQHGATWDSDEAFSIDTALMRRNPDTKLMIDALLQYPGSACERNDRGETAVQIASRTGHHEVAEFISNTYPCH
jgi:hypothetical protein